MTTVEARIQETVLTVALLLWTPKNKGKLPVKVVKWPTSKVRLMNSTPKKPGRQEEKEVNLLARTVSTWPRSVKKAVKAVVVTREAIREATIVDAAKCKRGFKREAMLLF
jgi:hypothetical protein